jgi:hypothetical protein
VDHTLVLAENTAIEMDNVATGVGVGADFADDAGVIAVWDKANVLAVRFVGYVANRK